MIAEGEKESAILKAEASKEAQIKEAEGEAEAIRKLNEAEADALKCLRSRSGQIRFNLKSFEALGKVADGQATKIIVPSDLQN